MHKIIEFKRGKFDFFGINTEGAPAIMEYPLSPSLKLIANAMKTPFNVIAIRLVDINDQIVNNFRIQPHGEIKMLNDFTFDITDLSVLILDLWVNNILFATIEIKLDNVH